MTEGKRLDRNQLIAAIVFFIVFTVLGVFVWPWLLIGSVLALLFIPQALIDYRAHG